MLADDTIPAPEGTTKDAFCREQAAPPALLLPAHSAPLGMTFYSGEQFPEAMRGDLFLALHGAYDHPIVDGVAGEPQDFLTGFTIDSVDRWLGRPVDVQVGPDGSLWVTDDAKGRVYTIRYTGTP